jgi:protein-disulfide isomerase
VLLEEFVERGKIRFITRHYAFLGHESTRAAEASECATEQDAFEAFSHLLYSNQQGFNEGGFSDLALLRMAAFMDLDVDAFDACLASGRYLATVLQDVDDALALDVSRTPSVFVNGVYVTPADEPTVVAAIEAALNAALAEVDR